MSVSIALVVISVFGLMVTGVVALGLMQEREHAQKRASSQLASRPVLRYRRKSEAA